MNLPAVFHEINQFIIDGLGVVLVVLFAIEVTAKVGAYTYKEVMASVKDARRE